MTEARDAAVESGPLPWGERVSDWFNPILVREVVQALRSKVFLMTLSGSVLAVVMLTLLNVYNPGGQEAIGRRAFSSSLLCLTPIILFIVPMQAFLSMRGEVTGGTTEQLMLTQLTPRRILYGKLAAAGAQFVLFLAVFAPVMAMTFVLRGVDVPTIALVLFFAVLASLSATVVCIALAAVGRFKVVSSLMQGLASAALFTATFGCMAYSFELPRDIGWMLRSSEFWGFLTGITSMFVAGIFLFGIIATTTLAHSYENRSTPYRVFIVAATLLAFALFAWNVPRGYLDEALPAVAATAPIAGLPIWLYACCEDTPLSPRVRTLVPKSHWRALLAVPWLPGGGRGLLFTVMFGVAVMVLGVAVPLLFGETPDTDVVGMGAMGWLYAILYGAIGRGIRSRLPSGPRRSYMAFSLTLLFLLFCILVPLMVDVVLRSGSRMHWNPLHFMNPFFTIVEHDHDHEQPGVLVALAVAAGFAMFAHVPRIRQDVREVLFASAERRAIDAR